MNKIFLNNIGDLCEIQRSSYYDFLLNGITKELSSLSNPSFQFVNLQNKKKLPCFIYLYINEIKFNGPNLNINTCLNLSMNYTIQLHVPVEYSYPFTNFYKFEKNFKNEKELRIKQDIFFGEIPLMTEEGTFILNGCERIIISQIIRSPGIYFRKNFKTLFGNKIEYSVTIISNQGKWTKFILENIKNDASNSINSSLDKIYIQLSDLNSQNLSFKAKKQIIKTNKTKIFIYDLLKYFGLSLKEMLSNLKYPNYIDLQEITNNSIDKKEQIEIIENFFIKQKSSAFSLGEFGRYQLNKSLGLCLPKHIDYLTSQDFLGIIDGLIELKYYSRENEDIDDLKYKRIRSVGESLQNQFKIAITNLEKTLDDPENSFLSFENNSENFIITDLKIAKKFEKEQYSNLISKSSNIFDSYLITRFLKEFLALNELSQYMDQTNPLSDLAHKRRISLFGANGLNREHISNEMRDIQASHYARLCPIETPEGQNAGLITTLTLYGRINSFGGIESPYFIVKNGNIFSKKSAIFLNSEQEADITIAPADIKRNLQNTIYDSLVPSKKESHFLLTKNKKLTFIGMSSLQIISLGVALIPFLEHNDGNRSLMGSNMQRQAVSLIYPKKAIIGTGFETSAILDSSMVIKNYSEGIVTMCSSSFIEIKDNFGQKITYFLKKNLKSNQDVCINQRPIVWIGEHVFSGQIIADGPSTCDGELALGRNLMIAYMPWEGYNYEDAIVINENLIFNNTFSSLHIKHYDIELYQYLTGKEKLTNNLFRNTKYSRRHLNKDGIVKVGSYLKENDILIGKLGFSTDDSTLEIKLIKIFFPKVITDNYYVDNSIHVLPNDEGRVIDIRLISNYSLTLQNSIFPFKLLRIYIAQIQKIQIGDKLSGRHGNKGIISRILPSIDMPYLPDGTPMDILLNPLGVPSRMNFGQIFECLLGLASDKLGIRFLIHPFDEVYGLEASNILVKEKLKEAAIKTNQNWLYNSFHPGRIFLRDGRTGEYFDNPVTVGKTYMLKLIHLVVNKINARATGPYSLISQQPLAGKAVKGGQRFGEMEGWALEAYGCANTLQELLTIKADDIDGRNEILASIVFPTFIEKPLPFVTESFLNLIRQLNALGLNFSINKTEGGFTSTVNIKTTEINFFKSIEERLKLRILLDRYKKS